MRSSFFLSMLLFLLNSESYSRTYYVSTKGLATNAGTITAPINLSKVNTTTFAAGDSILLAKGETFYGRLDFLGNGAAAAPIFIGAYGTGAKPVVTGLTTLTTWKSLGGGLYESVLSTPPTKSLMMMLFDAALQPFGRYPKTGFYFISTHTGSTKLTSQNIKNIPSFVGGEIVQKKVQWIIDRATITKQLSTSVEMTPYVSLDHPSVTYENVNGSGFFFQNHVKACTVLGDWAYTASTKKVTVNFGKDAPTAHSVQVATVNRLLNLANKNYIVVNGISFKGANDNLVDLDFTNNCTFYDCEFAYAGVNAIAVSRAGYSGTNGNSITNSFIHHINNNGLDLISSTGWNISNNVISDIAMNSGMGLNGDAQYEGIFDMGGNSSFNNNTLNNVGYIGIKFIGSNVTISKNVISNTNLVKGDGGGIYSYGNTGTNRLIENNIVQNALGNISGVAVDTTNPYNRRGMGIYMDDYAANVTIRNNTCFANGYAGLYMNSNAAISATNNTFYDNKTSQVGGIEFGAVFSNMFMQNNILFSTAKEQLSLALRPLSKTYATSWSMDNNFYCRPLYEPTGIATSGYSKSPSLENYPDGGIVQAHDNLFYSLDKWKTYSNLDMNTVKSPASITSLSQLKFDYATNTGKTVQLDPTYSFQDARGIIYNTSVNLQPYSSIVLIQIPRTTATDTAAVTTAPADASRQASTATVTSDSSVATTAYVNPTYTFRNAKTVAYTPAQEEKMNGDEMVINAYPVPFNSAVTLQVAVKQPGQVTLNVYDSRGMLVRRIYDGRLTSEPRQFSVPAAGLTNGVYYIQLKGKTNTITKTITLLK